MNATCKLSYLVEDLEKYRMEDSCQDMAGMDVLNSFDRDIEAFTRINLLEEKVIELEKYRRMQEEETKSMKSMFVEVLNECENFAFNLPVMELKLFDIAEKIRIIDVKLEELSGKEEDIVSGRQSFKENEGSEASKNFMEGEKSFQAEGQTRERRRPPPRKRLSLEKGIPQQQKEIFSQATENPSSDRDNTLEGKEKTSHGKEEISPEKDKSNQGNEKLDNGISSQVKEKLFKESVRSSSVSARSSPGVVRSSSDIDIVKSASEPDTVISSIETILSSPETVETTQETRTVKPIQGSSKTSLVTSKSSNVTAKPTIARSTTSSNSTAFKTTVNTPIPLWDHPRFMYPHHHTPPHPLNIPLPYNFSDLHVPYPANTFPPLPQNLPQVRPEVARPLQYNQYNQQYCLPTTKAGPGILAPLPPDPMDCDNVVKMMRSPYFVHHPLEQKHMLGDTLFQLVYNITPDMALEVTPKLLELENVTLIGLIENHSTLRQKVQDVIGALQAQRARKK